MSRNVRCKRWVGNFCTRGNQLHDFLSTFAIQGTVNILMYIIKFNFFIFFSGKSGVLQHQNHNEKRVQNRAALTVLSRTPAKRYTVKLKITFKMLQPPPSSD